MDLKMQGLTKYLNLNSFCFTGILVSVGLALLLFGWENAITETRFVNRAALHDLVIESRLHFAIETSESVASFFSGSQNVTRAEFKEFTRRFWENLSDHGIQAIEWIPRVKGTDRAAYEAAAREDGYKEFVFTERTSQGEMVTSGDRGEYFPVYYVEPTKSNQSALGFDLASNTARLEALYRSRDTGQTTVSERITLVQEQGDTFSFLIFTPIYQNSRGIETIESRRQYLLGFTLAIFKIEDLVQATRFLSTDHTHHTESDHTESDHMGADMDMDMDMYIIDRSAPENKQILYPKVTSFQSITDLDSRDCVISNLTIGGRSWSITHCPKGNFLFIKGHLLSIFVLILGVVITFFVNSRFSLLSKQRKRDVGITTQWANLIDTANAPIFGIDLAGKINEWNRKAEDITGLPRHAVLGDDLVDQHIIDGNKDEVRNILNLALEGKETSSYDLLLFTSSGARVDILLNSTTRRDVEGNIIGAIGIGQDVTEIKTYQAQVIQASKLATLGEMSTSVAHELNQPLHTILMAASNIKDHNENGKLTPAFLQKKLQRIEGQVERASSIINHMRMFGRIDDQQPQLFDPEEAMQAALSLVGEQLRLANITLSIDFANSGLKVIGNQIQLEQVFINIILNARDAVLEEANNAVKKITIHGAPAGNNNIKISITDSGAGIDENLLPRIFEPFFTTKTIGHGTGLGLSVSYGIIRDIHGSLTAENTDKGTRFNIIIPVALIEQGDSDELIANSKIKARYIGI